MDYEKQYKKIGSELDSNIMDLQTQIDCMHVKVSALEKENKMLVELIERLGSRVRNLESMEQHI